MVPTMRDRLASVQRALADVIIPSIPANEPLALEQARLSLMQLQILSGQMDISMMVEIGESQAADTLDRKFAKLVGGEPSEAPAIFEAGQDLEAMRTRRIGTLEHIDQQIKGIFASGDATLVQAAQDEIVAHQRARRPIEDRWFGATFTGQS